MLRLWSWLEPPSFPLLIQNFAMMNGQCKQTNHRYSISVLLQICIIPLYHYRARPLDAAQTVMCQVDKAILPFYLRTCPTTTFSIYGLRHLAYWIPIVPDLFVWNPFDQLLRNWQRPILWNIAIYKQYVLQMTGSNFLPKIKLTLSFTNDSN